MDSDSGTASVSLWVACDLGIKSERKPQRPMTEMRRIYMREYMRRYRQRMRPIDAARDGIDGGGLDPLLGVSPEASGEEVG